MKLDIKIAKKMVQLEARCKSKSLEFGMTFKRMKQLYRTKKCYYTGLPLDEKTFTLDRVKSDIGYEDSNVVACHHAFNQYKSTLECGTNVLTEEIAIKGFKKLEKTLKEK